LSRTVSWVVNDGDSNATSATSIINVSAVNDAPTVSAGAVLNYTAGDTATAIDVGVSVFDVDDINIESATVTISGNYFNGEDVLSFTNTANITGTFNPVTGVLTLIGSDTVTNYQNALRSITYENLSGTPNTASRMITWIVNDGDNSSNAVISTINLGAVNSVSTLIAGSTLNYIENDPATVIDAGVSISDIDDTHIESATISISGNYINAEDVLAFVDTANITGSFNSATGVLTLTGSDTVVNYQNALQSITYMNTSDNPSTLSRTVSWVVNDGDSNSVAVTSTINVSAVNDAPVITAGSILNYSENDPAAVIDGGLSISDIDDTHIESAT
ncbi:hypothetical protein, partial [Cysteiniphilum marinum]